MKSVHSRQTSKCRIIVKHPQNKFSDNKYECSINLDEKPEENLFLIAKK